MKNKKVDANTAAGISACALLLIALYAIGRLGINGYDEPYIILNSLDYRTNPFTPATSWISERIASLWGHAYIAYRYIAVTLTAGAVAIASAFYYRRTREAARAAWVCALTLLLVLFLKSNGWYVIFTHDTFTVFFTTVTLVLSLWYISKPKLARIVAVGAVIAVSTACRMPNIITWPLLAIVMAIYAVCVKAYRRRALPHLAAGMCTTAALLLALVYAFYGGISQYREVLATYSFTGHTVIGTVTTCLYELAVWILPCMGQLFMAYWLMEKSQQIERRPARALAIAAVVCAAIGETCILWRLQIIPIQLIYVAVFWLLTLLAFGHNHKDRRRFVALSAIYLICMSPAAGSSSVMMKYMVFPALPVLLAYLPMGTPTVRHTVWGSYLLLLALNIASSLSQTFGDEGLTRLDTPTSAPRLRGMLTSASKAAVIDQVYEAYSRYSPDEYTRYVVQKDSGKYLYDYLFDARCPGLMHSGWESAEIYQESVWVEGARESVDAAISQPRARVAVLYIKSADESNPMLEMLRQRLRVDYEDDKCMVLVYTADQAPVHGPTPVEAPNTDEEAAVTADQ